MHTKRFNTCFKRWVQFCVGAIPLLPKAVLGASYFYPWYQIWMESPWNPISKMKEDLYAFICHPMFIIWLIIIRIDGQIESLKARHESLTNKEILLAQQEADSFLDYLNQVNLDLRTHWSLQMYPHSLDPNWY